MAIALFVRDLPPPADVVMETLLLFWGSLSLSLSLAHTMQHYDVNAIHHSSGFHVIPMLT